MAKTTEELVYDFANRQFYKAPINTARDLMCVCSDFANEFLAQPLSSRLTAEEKEHIKKLYYAAEASESDFGRGYVAAIKRIFGTDFCKEG